MKKDEWTKGFDAGYKNGMEDLAWALTRILDRNPELIVKKWSLKVKGK